jgi:mRNA interferase MazF
MKRGEEWLARFNPVVGHGQGGPRPALIVSSDGWNGPPGNLVTVVPITSQPRRLPSRVRVMPPEAGLDRESWVIGEQVRTVSTQRLTRRLGVVMPATMRAVADNVRLLLEL